MKLGATFHCRWKELESSLFISVRTASFPEGDKLSSVVSK